MPVADIDCPSLLFKLLRQSPVSFRLAGYMSPALVCMVAVVSLARPAAAACATAGALSLRK